MISSNRDNIFNYKIDFARYHSIYIYNNPQNNFKVFVVVHRKFKKLPSFGATRIFSYGSDYHALKDAIRLSRGMSYKIAMAGLPYGGAKAVIVSDKMRLNNRVILKSYAQWLTSLSDLFVTGADVGVSRSDIKYIRKYAKNVVGVRYDPVRFTGLGLLYSIEAVLEILYGNPKIYNRTFVIQGLGKIGMEVLKHIHEAKKIYVTDINKLTIRQCMKKFSKLNIEVVKPQEIYAKKVDIFVPCALGGVINKKSINQFKCKAICGGANNQLSSENMGKLLFKKNLLYAPDYVVNAGGLISVIDEYDNARVSIKRVESRVASIGTRIKMILQESARRNIPSNEIADSLAKSRLKIA